MLLQASNFVKGVDTSFIVILGISAFFLVGITVAMIVFAVRYNRKKHPKSEDVKENTKLEILWTLIPTILVIVMFIYGWLGYVPMRRVPNGALTVKATGMMWAWNFEYENGKTSNILVVPLNKPVKLNLFSPDVLHSLYIPAFRIKEDVVPGKKNYMWFKPGKIGEFDIFCAEYCGLRHSYMLSKVKVVTEEEYTKWVNEKQPVSASLTAVGEQVFKKNGCFACHSTDGTKIVGPSFKGIYGKSETVITNGAERQIIVDDEYLRKSINDPGADVVKGYNPGQMISYKTMISEEELKQLILFIKSLNEQK